MSILHRALMQFVPSYFSMSEEEQEVFKLTDNDIHDKIYKFVADMIGMGDDEHDHAKLLESNTIMLPYVGIGPNFFMLNEFFWNEKILKYPTLYDWNSYYHQFQVEAIAESSSDKYSPPDPYNQFSAWARAMVDNKFYYLNLLSMENHIYYKLDEFGSEWIDEHLPHDYVPGPCHNKKTEGGIEWDMTVDAGGKESWYEALRDFSYSYLSKTVDDHPNLGDVVFVQENSGLVSDPDTDPHLDYVFGNMNVLKQLTFRNFIEDCKLVQGDTTVLAHYTDQKVAEYKDALETEFARIKREVPLDVEKG